MTTFKPLACGFHSHTDASLDSPGTVNSKIIQAFKLGNIANCVTDHGTMSALVSHHDACKKLLKDKKIGGPIKSIHGIEAYVVDELRPAKILKNGKEVPQYYHLTIHFKTQAAYKYFCQLSPIMNARAVVKYGEVKPLLKLEELEPISGQITLGSGCLIGCVQKNVLNGRSDWAEQMYLKLRDLAGPGNYFVEVFPHRLTKDYVKPVRGDGNIILEQGKFVPITSVREWDPNSKDQEPCTIDGEMDIQRDPNLFVIKMAEKYGDPIVISLDDHFACEHDYETQCVKISGGKEDWKFSNSYHMYSSEECAVNLKRQLGVSDKQIEEWIDNSYKFVELFDKYKMETADDRWLLPTTEMVYNIKDSSTDKLMEIVNRVGRLPKPGQPDYQSRKERFDYEVSVLRDNGVADFLPYFFVIEDVASYCEKMGILYNCRGSAGGSYVLYAMGVSITDPFKYDLPFERFLTLGRIKSGSLPDIDFDIQERDPVIAYLKEKYGDRCSLIATNLLMKLKSSILDVERSRLGQVRKETQIMCAMMPAAGQGKNDLEWLNGYKDKDTGAHVPGFLEDQKDQSAEKLRLYIKNNPEIWETVLRCLGINKTRGVHAGGVIIAPEPVQNFMPTIMTNKGIATAYDMKGVERVGGVKFDFLGVSTLHSIGITLKSIKEIEGIDIKWDEFPDDSEVYSEIVHKDKLAGIFQINTKIVRPYVLSTKPKSISDIATLTSLMRPGSMDAPAPNPDFSGSAAEYYVAVAQGKQEPYYIHENVKHIFEKTLGVCVLQEQTLRVFRDIAGYTYETSEVVRRAIGKKVLSEMEIHIGILKNKCLERGWSEWQAQRLAETLIKSAGYSFNMAHAASYSIVAYNGCWLKKHYPLHFWKGELTVNSDNHEKLRSYFSEFKHYLLPISITKSHPSDWSIEDGGLRPPLSLIKGCGAKSVDILKRFIEAPLSEIGIGEIEDELV